MKHGLSHTRKTTFRLCKRKHHLMYDLGVRPAKEAMPLTVGTAMHLWLECWFGASEWVPPGASVNADSGWAEVADLLENFNLRHVAMWRAFNELDAAAPFEAARLRAMVLAYHFRWRGQQWHALAVEKTFRVPLVNPEDGTIDEDLERDGKIDAIVQDLESGETLGVEHKSYSGPLKPDADYWIKLRSDAQCSDYHIGASELGVEISGIVYDVVCKPDLDPLEATPLDKRKMTKGERCNCATAPFKKGRKGIPLKIEQELVHPADCEVCHGNGWADLPRLYANQRDRDETPGEYGMRCFHTIMAEPDLYLHRKLVVRLEDEIRQHELDDWGTAQDIKAEEQRDYHPRNPDACFRFGGSRCEFHPVCFGSASVTDERLYKIRPRTVSAI